MRRGGLVLGLVAVLGAAFGSAYLLTCVPDPPLMPASVTATRPVRALPPDATWTTTPTAAAVPTPVQGEATDEVTDEVDIPPLLRDT